MSGSALPYHDTKPVGAADFYFVHNATFTFIRDRFGEDGLRRYWAELGREYQKPVWERWRDGGLAAVADYWREFFAAEPGSDVEVTETDGRVELNVRVCPAIRHLRAGNRTILPTFCRHCYFMGDAAAEAAGLAARVCGGAGACRQTFLPRAEAPPQRLEDIALVDAALEASL
jgi:hypothetical protein